MSAEKYVSYLGKTCMTFVGASSANEKKGFVVGTSITRKTRYSTCKDYTSESDSKEGDS